MGKLEIIAGLHIMPVGLIGVILGNDKRHWNQVLVFGAELTILGAIDAINGWGEFLLGWTPLCLGILAVRLTNKFEPFIAYGSIFKSPTRAITT